MKVVVTGANGKIGREAVKSLKAAGHTVVGWDLVGPGPVVDCTDFGQVFGSLSGIDLLGGVPDAMLHLAGIPMPGKAADHVIFQANTVSTYNVMSACARLGVKRLVWASSETLLGLPFNNPPDFVPLDESHPDRPEWSYALSKLMGERMAEQFVRWAPGLSIASLRFSNVLDENDYLAFRADEAKALRRSVNLWSYVDARDAGEACRLALEASFSGHEAMLVAAADTLAPRPTAELLQEKFPGVTVLGDIGGHRSLLNCAKAHAVVGYQARHSWRAQ